MKSTLFLILNWNNAPDTISCLSSLTNLERDDYQILVIDNGSTDDSVLAIERSFPEIEVVKTGKNLGYAGGNNLGIDVGLSRGYDFLGILNNDIIVAPDFLESLISIISEQDDAGVVTPLMADSNDDRLIWTLGASVNPLDGTVVRLHAGEKVVDHCNRDPFEVEVAPGAAMLVKREVFERVGSFDEMYFLYYEEADWSFRLRASGYRIKAVPSAIVSHHHSAALGPSSPVIDYYMLRNQLRLIGHYWRGKERWKATARILLRNLVTIAAYTVKSEHGSRFPHRNARLLALRDAVIGRWGKMGNDVVAKCGIDGA